MSTDIAVVDISDIYQIVCPDDSWRPARSRDSNMLVCRRAGMQGRRGSVVSWIISGKSEHPLIGTDITSR